MRKFYTIMIKVFLLMALPATAWTQDRFYCSGTEPFWNSVISHDTFTFKVADKDTVNFKVMNPIPFGNQNLDQIRLYATKDTKTNKSAAFIIQKQQCSDGMSEHAYEYQALVLYDTYAFVGCCMKK
jgi:uncharacterized membrane protein